MKRSISALFYLFLFFLIVLTGCNSSDDDIPGPIDDDENMDNPGMSYDDYLTGKINLWRLEASGVDAAFNGQNWVVVGRDIFISQDASHWEKISVGLSHYYSEIETDGEKFVALSSDRIIASQDGRTWSTTLEFSNAEERDLIWTGNGWVVSIDRDHLYRSSDAVNWTLVSNAPRLDRILLANDRLLGFGTQTGYSKYFLYESTDGGLSWSEGQLTSGSGNDARKFLYAGGTIYSFESGNVFTSEDGINWTVTEVGYQNMLNPVYYNGRFYAVRQKASSGSPVLDLGAIVHSEDALTWTELNTGTHGMLTRIVPTENGFLAVGDDILWSADGLEWNYRVPRLSKSHRRVNWATDRAIFTGYDEGFLVTEDLANFELLGYKAYGAGFSAGTWDGEKYILVGTNGRLITSPDGVNFTSPSTPTLENLVDVHHAPVGTVVVGSSGTILFSNDGHNWEDYSLGSDIGFHRVEWFGTQFFAVSTRGIFRSSDGKDWTGVDVTPEDEFFTNIFDIAYNGETYVVVANNNFQRIYTSNDGINWTERDPEPEEYYYKANSIEYTGREFVMLVDAGVGYLRLDASNDGISWKTVFEFPSGVSAEDFAWTGTDFVFTGTFASPVLIGRVDL